MTRVALLAAALALAPVAAVATGPQLYLVEEPIAVRPAPDASFPALATLQPGAPGLAVLEPDASGLWGHVDWHGSAAWVPLAGLRRAFSSGPELFRVTGVAADDTLNVRAGPSASAADIGDLAPGALVEVLGAGPEARWGEITHGGRNGWVSLAYLAPVEPERVQESPVPVGLLCAGAEPFWSVAVDADALHYRDPDGGEDVAIAEALPAAGRRFPALVLGAGGEALVVRPEACSDGMSDMRYGWTAEYLDGTRLLTGCCRIDTGG